MLWKEGSCPWKRNCFNYGPVGVVTQSLLSRVALLILSPELVLLFLVGRVVGTGRPAWRAALATCVLMWPYLYKHHNISPCYNNITVTYKLWTMFASEYRSYCRKANSDVDIVEFSFVESAVKNNDIL